MEPANVLTRFQSSAGAGEKLVSTDIPGPMLASYVELATKARKHGIKALPLVPPLVDQVRPDFEAVRAKIKSTLAANGSK
jgi:hypothetical protein